MRRNLDGVQVEYLDAFAETTESQCKRILSHMIDGHRIDGMQSLRLFGCNRLPARIMDIQRIMGIVIDRQRVKVRGKWYMEYFIRGIYGK